MFIPSETALKKQSPSEGADNTVVFWQAEIYNLGSNKPSCLLDTLFVIKEYNFLILSLNSGVKLEHIFWFN